MSPCGGTLQKDVPLLSSAGKKSREVSRDRLNAVSQVRRMPRPFHDGNVEKLMNALDNICCLDHILGMAWEVGFDPAFAPEFDALPTAVQNELLA